MRRSGIVALALAPALVALALSACSDGSRAPGDAPAASGVSPSAASADVAFPAFTDVTAASGIAFERESGFDGTHWRVAETVGGGLALLDVDDDGRIDIFFTNGRRLGEGKPSPNALHRNLGDWRFEDVSGRSGLTAHDDMSLGCAVADLDADGRPELYVTNHGPNRLYTIGADGKLTDIAPRLGVTRGEDSMDSGAVFFDMDADGDLDLYVAAYCIDDRAPGGSTSPKPWPPLVHQGVAGYWPPLSYRAAPDALFENRDGVFADVSESSGIRAVEPGRGLGVVVTDFNGDGHADLFVANDLSANFMFLGDGKGRFEEAGFLNGTAFGENGDALGSMGIDIADYDGDGLTDLVVTNYYEQPNNLYRASAPGAVDYAEMAHVTGVASGNVPEVSWGANFADFDLDGWKDLFVANGHLNPGARAIVDSTSYPQRNRMYRNDAGRRMLSVAARDGLAVEQVSRGSAHGDLDNDGDLDLVVLNSIGPPQLLRNEALGASRDGPAWALVRLVGGGRNVDAIGARVTVTAGGRTQWQERASAASYLSVNDPRLHFGLGDATTIERLVVRWPDGVIETRENLPARRLLTVRKGTPEPEIAPLSKERPRPPSGR